MSERVEHEAAVESDYQVVLCRGFWRRVMVKRCMTYSDLGGLKGYAPNGQSLTVHHLGPGNTRFTVLCDGQFHEWLSADRVEKVFGIPVHMKKTGSQAGYPSETVTRAPWRHLVDRYNEGDPDVTQT